MPIYRYKALNEAGLTVRGTTPSNNESDLETRLQAIGLDLYDFKEVTNKSALFSRGIRTQDLIVLCVQLGQLEKAGVALLDSISDMRDTVKSPQMKNLLGDVYESIKGGQMLSAALAQHPNVFDKVFVGLISAGEETGQLAEVLEHLSEHLKWTDAIKRKIRGATYYPMFLLLMMSGVIALMMMYVIPKLTTFLLSQNFELPFYTKALIDTSGFFVHYWYLVFGTPVFGTIFIKFLSRHSEVAAYVFDRIKLYIPFIGSAIRKIEMARFCRFFSLTFKSGIGILECIDIANNTVSNRVIKNSIKAARKNVAEGNSIYSSLRLSNQFPDLVLRMFKVGENSGNLEESLKTVNFFYDREVTESVDNMIGLIQPALTIVMGAIMMWISIAVFGPLYGSFSKMKF